MDNKKYYQKGLTRRQMLSSLVGRFKQRDTFERDPASIVIDLSSPNDLFQNGEYEQAAIELRQILNKHPDYLPGQKLFCLCLLKANHFLHAKQVLQEIKKKQGTESFCSLYLGLIAAKQGELQQAVQFWQNYKNLKQPIIQREINLQLALIEQEMTSDTRDIAQKVEQAICKQQEYDDQHK